jgi:hypothetical protein
VERHPDLSLSSQRRFRIDRHRSTRRHGAASSDTGDEQRCHETSVIGSIVTLRPEAYHCHAARASGSLHSRSGEAQKHEHCPIDAYDVLIGKSPSAGFKLLLRYRRDFVDHQVT